MFASIKLETVLPKPYVWLCDIPYGADVNSSLGPSEERGDEEPGMAGLSP